MLDNYGKQENPVLLGPMTFWWKVRVILYTPLWFWSLIDPERDTKSWSEFKYGLINHECDWDKTKPKRNKKHVTLNCRHYGCNMTHVTKNLR